MGLPDDNVIVLLGIRVNIRTLLFVPVLLAAVAVPSFLTAADGVDLSLPTLRLFTESQTAQRNGNLEAAIAGYRKVLQSAPQFAGAYFNLGLALEQAGRPGEALREFLAARKLDPSIPAVDLFIGIESYSVHDYAEAEQSLARAVKTLSTDPQTWLWLGKTKAATGKFTEAARVLEKARSLAPKDPSVLYNLGQAYAKLSQQTYESLYAADPKSYLVDLVLAQSYSAQRNNAEAIRKYRAIEQREPHLPGIHESIASLYFSEGDFKLAKEEFLKELAIDPNNSAALTGVGMILDREQDSAHATDYLRHAVKIDASSSLAHLYLGRAMLHSDRTGEAVPELTEAARLDPSDATVHYQLYQAYTRLKQPDSAAAELQRFKQLDQAAKDAEQQRADALRNRENTRARNPDSGVDAAAPPQGVSPK